MAQRSESRLQFDTKIDGADRYGQLEEESAAESNPNIISLVYGRIHGGSKTVKKVC